MRDHILYDSVTLGAAAVEATLFQQAVGAKATGYYECNMEQVGQLPDGQGFDILAISKSFLPGAVIADAVALDKGWWELKINDQVKLGPMPIFCVPSNTGILPIPDAASAGTTTYAIGAGASFQNVMKLDNPISLSGGVAFKAILHWPVAPNAKTIYWMFHGVLTG